MPKVEKFVPGLPCWVDMSVNSSQKRKDLMAFYASVFGWRWEEGGPETGFYTMGFKGDGHVIAIGENEHGIGAWVTYFGTEDIHATLARAVELGAQVVMPAMEVMGAGSMALLMDPRGAMHGLWQPALFSGFDLQYEPSTSGWYDLETTDPEAAIAYYADILGADVVRQTPDGSPLLVLAMGEQWFASVSPLTPGGPTMPPHWTPIYVVDDLTATADKVRTAGGSVIVENMPVPGMPFTVMGAGQEPS